MKRHMKRKFYENVEEFDVFTSGKVTKGATAGAFSWVNVMDCRSSIRQMHVIDYHTIHVEDVKGLSFQNLRMVGVCCALMELKVFSIKRDLMFDGRVDIPVVIHDDDPAFVDIGNKLDRTIYQHGWKTKAGVRPKNLLTLLWLKQLRHQFGYITFKHSDLEVVPYAEKCSKNAAFAAYREGFTPSIQSIKAIEIIPWEVRLVYELLSVTDDDSFIDWDAFYSGDVCFLKDKSGNRIDATQFDPCDTPAKAHRLLQLLGRERFA